MNDQSQWDTFRYVLDDPTLDRGAFEARMLDDSELAIAVAQAMEQVDLLEAASRTQGLTVRVNQPTTWSWHWSSLAVLVAGLLLAIGVFANSFSTESTDLMRGQTPISTASATPSQTVVAQRWLALSDAEMGESASTDAELQDGQMPSQSLTDTSSIDDDWLIDAAREFYAQGATS